MNDNYVAAANGSTIYLLESSTGKVLWSRRCAAPASAPPAVSEDRVFVPLMNGKMESFPTDNNGYGSFTFIARGSGTARPLVTERTVAWPTSHGDLNIAARFGPRRKGVAYRLVSDDAIISSATVEDETVFVASLDGYVYAIDEQSGKIKWEVSTGEGISQTPATVGNSVYVVTDDERLFKLSLEKGKHEWAEPIPNIGKYVGASRDRLYLTDSFGDLVVISPDSGAILSRVSAGNVEYIVRNDETDRLYIGSDGGLVQCLREVASKMPHFHANEALGEIAPTPTAAEKAQPPAIKAEEDPFAEKSQPAEKPAESDPFAVEDDPFKTDGGF